VKLVFARLTQNGHLQEPGGQNFALIFNTLVFINIAGSMSQAFDDIRPK
jgi:hypothetical protein